MALVEYQFNCNTAAQPISGKAIAAWIASNDPSDHNIVIRINNAYA